MSKKCKLDIDEPKLVIIGNVSGQDLRKGLVALRDKVAQSHDTSMWFPHPMPGFPDFYGKVWEWDFKPANDKSSTRPGWRILAYIPNPQGPEPILARPFIGWDKSQAPKNNQEKYIADALKKFLAANIQIQPEEEIFVYRENGPTQHLATCQRCWETLIAVDRDELDLMADAHKSDCPGHPPE